MHSGHVRMYVCGPTVYDHAHLGHARSEVFFDTVARYLRFLGFRVTHVRNLTDIDDKIIDRSLLMETSTSKIADRCIESYHDDMNHLGTRRPDHEPRVTEYIPEIISIIGKLISSGNAYAQGGNVLFRVGSVEGYGALASSGKGSSLRHASMATSIHTKNDGSDFALWKRADGPGPAWKSPWGLGRPGWHIECVAMAQHLLGSEFDIHGGGRDLLFPHHENERAIAMACYGTPLARYWIHHELVTADNRKLSRSCGTPYLIGDLCSMFHPEAIRLFILSTHYRRTLDFTMDRIGQAQAALTRLYRLYERASRDCDPPGTRTRRDTPLIASFCKAMDNDLNIPEGINIIFAAARRLNRVINKHHGAGKMEEHDKEEFCGLVNLCREVLGILYDS
jgi:cysteinyl-tRNA synthetase